MRSSALRCHVGSQPARRHESKWGERRTVAVEDLGRGRRRQRPSERRRRRGAASYGWSSFSGSNVNSTVTASPDPLPPRTLAGTARRAPPVFLSRQTLVFHETPSTTARTGVRPHGRVTGGASVRGIGANVHPPLPG